MMSRGVRKVHDYLVRHRICIVSCIFICEAPSFVDGIFSFVLSFKMDNCDFSTSRDIVAFNKKHCKFVEKFGEISLLFLKIWDGGN